MLAVRMMRQLLMLGEGLDPAWTVMVMSSSMLLLLDYSLTVAFEYVARFSAGMTVGIAFDNLEDNFAGEFMSRSLILWLIRVSPGCCAC